MEFPKLEDKKLVELNFRSSHEASLLDRAKMTESWFEYDRNRQTLLV